MRFLPRRAIAYSPTADWVEIDYQNVGPGVALNIWGVIFGTEPTAGEPGNVSGHSGRQGTPLPTGGGDEVRWHQGGTMVYGTNTVAGHKLYAPRQSPAGNMVSGNIAITAQLTFTYRDVFNRKHASIFDLTPQIGWIPVHTGLVDKELPDIERENFKAIPVAD
jgi:hypothetical protein